MSHISGKAPVIVSNNYESLIIDEVSQTPRNNKVTHCYSSKHFWFGVCHSILFLLLIIVALIVFNHLGYTPVISHFLQTERASEKLNGNLIDLKPGQTPCPLGYVLFEETNSCYKERALYSFSKTCTLFQATPIPTLFEDAQSSCEADGAQLTSIHSEIENIFIAGLYHESDRQIPKIGTGAIKWSFWIGMTRTNGNWSWLDGSPVNYKNWLSREETTNQKNHQAVIRATGYKWRGMNGEKRGFVCKKPSRTTSNTKKTSTTKPCPAEYTWLQHTGSCYKVFGNKASFNNATNVCDDDLAQLTSVHSELEMIFLRGLIIKNREDNNLGPIDMWIGLTHKDHQLHWIDRTEVDYKHWSPGEPNFSNEYNVTKLSYWGRWKSAKPSTEYGFICKKY